MFSIEALVSLLASADDPSCCVADVWTDVEHEVEHSLCNESYGRMAHTLRRRGPQREKRAAHKEKIGPKIGPY